MIVRRRSPIRFRGMGQALPYVTSGSCQYLVPGITPDPGIPFCSGSYQMTPAQIASVKAAQAAGGYTDNSEPGGFVGAFAPSALNNPNVPPANETSVTLTPYMPPVAPAAIIAPAPAQSNAPNAVSTAVPSAPVQSNAPNPVVSTSPVQSWASLFGSGPAATPAAAASGCFSLFQGESCIGPIGSMTLLAVGGGIFGLFLLFGGKR